jgi:hypothetical protein
MAGVVVVPPPSSSPQAGDNRAKITPAAVRAMRDVGLST